MGSYNFIESELDSVLAEFSRYNTVAVDLETTGLSPLDSRILLCQIGFPGIQYVIDARKVDLTPLAPFLSSNKWKKIVFNGKFESKFFQHYHNVLLNNVFDCFLAEKVLNSSGFNNSFEDLAKKYLNVTLDKTQQKSFVGKRAARFTERQLQYAADDVDYLFPLMEAQIEQLAKKDLTHIAQLEFDLSSVVASMELAGVPIDKEKWTGILAEYAEEHEQSRLKVTSILFDQEPEQFEQQLGLFEDDHNSHPAGQKFNINSNPDLIKAFARVGIDLESTKEEEISLINHPAAEELLNYKGLQKIMSSYGYKSILQKIHPFTNRIHPDWKQIGTDTGRFSCKEPNMQQIPARFRSCVGGVENYMLLGADFSQMELRILAQESKDPILLEAFQTGKDIHTATASTMFNLPFDKITKEQRFTAKTLNFGITYGMGIAKFENMMNTEAKKNGSSPITTQQAFGLMDRYKETYKTATKYLQQVGMYALREGFVQTRLGRKRYFNPPSTSLPAKKYSAQVGAIKREGANMPIQGTNADITKLAMVYLHQEMKDFGFKADIILQVHDEIVLLAHKSQIDVLKPLVIESMTKAGQGLLPDVPVVVDAYAEPYWKH